ncbi:uncharacterized protein LOC128187311 [Crassostrea angulata]|uniref:uncharacterized protein LOC128187311 n=1 Tax=Magallana angulata TaxID=2784310 RepID=UPI0022B146B6|nr:uncharacterized protein LOC128187311 [Crassostrea angulata]
MAQFQGTWEDRELDPSALAFMDAIGLGEYKDKYKDERSTMTYEINGNKWKITYLSSMYPDQPMVYDVEIGKPFDGKGPDGSDVKTTMTVISDSEVKEDEKTNFEDGKDRSFVITRKVNGDVMDVFVEAPSYNAKMTGKMYRKK